MRLILLFALIIFSFGLSAQSSLKLFVQNLSSKYKIDIAIDPSLLQNENIKIESPNTIEDVFSLLTKAGLDYFIISNNYILLRKSAVLPEQTKTISGKIVDQSTGEPIPFASVYLSDMSAGTSTDEDGRYKLKVNKNSDVNIEVSYLGYENQKFSSDKQITNIALKESLSQISEVVIIASSLQNIDLAKINFESEYNSLKLIKLNSNDLIKTMQLSLPGVSRTDNAQIMIRSMRQDKTLSLVNNIPVLKTGHYFNLISNFNELFFKEIDVYKNVFPAQYGNALGGLVKYTSDINNKKSYFSSTSNLLYSGFAASLANDKFVLNIGGRKSYIEANKNGILSKNLYQLRSSNAGASDIVSNVPDASFYDLNAQLTYRYSKNNTATLSALSNKDSESLNWKNNRQFFLGNTSLELVQNFNNYQNSKNIGYSFENKFSINDQWKWSIDAHYYRYADTFNLKTSINELRDNMSQPLENDYRHNQEISTKSISSHLNYKLNNTQNIDFGVYTKNIDLSFKAKENHKTITSLSNNANQYSVFGDYNINGNSFVLKVGSKLTNFSNISGNFLEPYLSANYKVNKDFCIKSTFAHRIQNLNLLDFETRFAQNLNYYYLSNDSLQIQTGNHLMLGANYTKNKFVFDVEAYSYRNDGIQLFTNLLPVFSKEIIVGGPKPNPADAYKFFSGKNNIIGIDFFASYSIKKWSSSMNYTLSKNSQRFKGIYKNQEVPSPTDRRHSFSFNNTYTFDKLSIGSSIGIMSGSPYLSYITIKPEKGKKDVLRKEIIEYLPTYFSLDFNADYAVMVNPFKLNVGLSVTNITNNDNVKFIQQTGSFENKKNEKPIVTGNQSLMLGRFFNLHVKTRF